MKTLKRAVVVYVILSAIFNHSGRCDVTWDSSSVEMHRDANTNIAGAVFRYRNNTSAPIAFLSIAPSCDCLKIESTKRVVMPGEFGQIKVSMRDDGLVNVNGKNVTVRTDSGDSVLSFTSASAIRLENQSVLWHVGDACTGKATRLIGGDSAVHLHRWNSSSDDFVVNVVEDVGSKSIKILVVPHSTIKIAQCTIRVDYYENEVLRVAVMHALVK